MYPRVLPARAKIVLVLLPLAIYAGMATQPTGALLAGSGPVAGGPGAPFRSMNPLDLLAVAAAAPRPPETPAEAPEAPAALEAPAAPEPPAAAPAPTETAPPLPPGEVVVIPPARVALRPVLVRAAHEHGLPTDVVMAQAWAESSWRDKAVSNVGAVGVLQLTPDTVEFVSRRLLKLDRPLDPLDPAANARMGARYMRHLLDRTGGDFRQALIAYNQGLTALRRDGPYLEAETYADRVLALRSQFEQR